MQLIPPPSEEKSFRRIITDTFVDQGWYITANSSSPRNSSNLATSSSTLTNCRWIFCHLKVIWKRKSMCLDEPGKPKFNKLMLSNYRSLESFVTFDTVPTQQLHSPEKQQIVLQIAWIIVSSINESNLLKSRDNRMNFPRVGILPRWINLQLRGFAFKSITVSTYGTDTMFTKVLKEW